MSIKRNTLPAFLLLTASVALSACATTTPTGHDARTAKMNAVLERAAGEAESQGKTEQSLVILEQMYKRNSGDPATALKYAQALRQQSYFNRAAIVLEPFSASDEPANANVVIEYASVLASMGKYAESEEAARKAVMLAPDSGQAYHVLGIALDAQGHHEQAQVAFEKGLERWEGNPSPILNNMGLNLAAQGFLDEAVETLRKAMDTAPNRMEIERNLRIVSALQYQPPLEGTRLVPKPPRKPEPQKSPVAGDPILDDSEETVETAAPVGDVEIEPAKIPE